MRKWWAFILLFVALAAHGQRMITVQDLEQQRRAALAEIEMTNKLLQEATLSARNSLNRLNLLSNQILSRRKVINLLSQEMNGIDSQITALQREIRTLEGELEKKKDNYAASVRNIQRRISSQDKLLFILSADNFSQSVRRMRYLREYSHWQKNQASDILAKQSEIRTRQDELNRTRQEKQALLAEREAENSKLLAEEVNQKKEVQQLDKQQKALQDELRKKQQQAAELNRQIDRMIAEEVARADAAAKAAQAAAATPKTDDKAATVPATEERVADVRGGYAMTKAEKQLSDNFANNRGKLPFPLQGQYAIVGHFGEQQHQELKYVKTNNNGIDIQTVAGTDARAVFNGEVTRVFVLPGYNNSVIVRHGNYLTVYSNLSQVYVKAGDKVSTRQSLGRIYSDTEDGNTTILHFQLWKERDKLNPTPWLDL